MFIYKRLRKMAEGQGKTAVIWYEHPYFVWNAFYFDQIDNFDHFLLRMNRINCPEDACLEIFVYRYDLNLFDVISVD